MYGYKDVPSVANDTLLLLLNGMYHLWYVYYHMCNLHVFHLVNISVQVSDVSVNTVTSTSMTVTWTSSFNTTVNAKHIVISSLSSGLYTVSVASINDAGRVPFSSSTNFTIG